MRFKIDWASLIVGSKFTVFALFYLVFEGNFPSTNPWGAYIWRGVFSEFYGMPTNPLIAQILVFVMSSPLFSQKQLQMVELSG